MKLVFSPRGIWNVSKLPPFLPPATWVRPRLPASRNASFRYHIPRRIQDFSTSRTTMRYVNPSVNPPSREPEASTPWPAAEVQTHTKQVSSQSLSKLIRDRKAANFNASGKKTWISVWRSASTTECSRLVVALGNNPWSHQKRSFGGSSHEKYAAEFRDGPVKEAAKAPTPPSRSDPLHSSPETSHEHHFMDRLHMPQFHRPTKEELLAAATGFWSRLRVRFKWSTIRSSRPFNVDEITGFISWILLGHVVWIVIGTTTFVSLGILAINTIFAQETLAGWIGNYLTKSSGIKVVFESAVVPKWGDGVITFKNVFVSRRPGQNRKPGVSKGSPEAAAIAAAALEDRIQEDTNYTQFDITLGEVNVTLSFRKWWNSRGLLQNVEIRHVRGVVDRTHVHWTGEQVDPKSYRHEHNPGDFEIDFFKVEDLLVTVHQPNDFRPFPVSIYSAELPRLRKQWMFYDLLSANSMTGEYDRSLFTIHPRQTNSYTGAQLDDPDNAENEPWKKHSRIRIDALNIDHLNRNVEGPFSWIHEGNVDIVADIMIPNDNDESVIKVMSDFYDRIEATLTSKKHLDHAQQDHSDDDEPHDDIVQNIVQTADAGEDDKRFLVMDLRVHLNDVRAVVPLFTKDLSYVNSALIRPIVAYINSRRTFIPINCRVVKRASDFNGSWTIFDSGLMDDLSAEVYDAFARDVTDEQARLRRFKKVGLWSLQLAFQAIFLGMAGNIA